MYECIYVPSRGRAQKLTTPYVLPFALEHRIVVVVRYDELHEYANAAKEDRQFEFLALPKNFKGGLSETRQWILEQSNDRYLIMLDDDITGINIKKDLSAYGTIVKSDPNEFIKCFAQLRRWMDDGFAHVSFADRFIAARPSKLPYYENGRIAQTLFYNRDVLVKHRIRFDRVALMQDLDVNLQLLGLGYRNRVSVKYSFNSRWYGQPGGCSAYRTSELHDKVARKMEKLHPGITKLIPKPKGGGMTMRTSWTKAFGYQQEIS